MCRFKRLHHSGTEALISEHPDRGWRVQINLREVNHTPMTITGYLQPTALSAKVFADQEVAKYGHVCNTDCGGWKESYHETPLLFAKQHFTLPGILANPDA